MLFTVAVICLFIYIVCSIWFLAASLLQLHLLWHATKAPLISKSVVKTTLYPSVTIQVPVYNERYVISRLLKTLGKLNYPKKCFDIQVLDDSTDTTSDIIREEVIALRKSGINIKVFHRTERDGYKAGALQAGITYAEGDLIAIFDADFIPPQDFLERLTSHFADPHVGGVQSRWTHDNLEENALTRIQAFLLDSHFSLEQQGRSAAGYFLNFNGTAGIWRKQCILDCGGWNGDVLTEDFELSYRAQLKGWTFKYDNHVTVPAELPAEINAFKTQQFRWAKGMAQTARQHLLQVLRSNVSVTKKWHAIFHLLGSVSFVAVLGNILMSLPIIAGRHFLPSYYELSGILLVTGLTLPVVCTYYYFGTSSTLPRKYFWKYFPFFLVVYMALAVQNSIGVIQGLLGMSSPFIRTPKSTNKSGAKYNEHCNWTRVNNFEVLILLYILTAIVFSFYWNDYLLVMFLLMVLTGLLILLYPAARNVMIRQHRPYK